MKITTDEEYFKLLERIVKGAEYLENPLITEEDKRKGMILYDRLCKEVTEYQAFCRNNRNGVQQRTESIQKVAV